MEILAWVLAGAVLWLFLACICWAFVFMPMFRCARRADALAEAAGPDLDPQPLGTHRSPPRTGYAALVFDRVADLTRSLLGVDRSWILVRDPGGGRRDILAAARGLDEDLIGRRFTLDEVPRDQACVVASAPIILHEAFHGTLCAAAPARPDTKQLELLTELAELCAAALGQLASRREAERAIDAQVGELQYALESWDDETAAHSEHVVGLALGVGKRLGLDPVALVELELGAQLHDVGKLRVPGTVLRKPGPLTLDERQLVECHATWGARIVARIPALQAVAGIIWHHHERFDGNGYPSRVAASRIPLAARILGVCDAYSAMTRDRPYRRARSQADAIAELWANAGTQFDPDVVEALTEEVWDGPAPGLVARPSRRLPRKAMAAAAVRQSRTLAAAGGKHASDMVRRRYFAHTSLGGRRVRNRLAQLGLELDLRMARPQMLGQRVAHRAPLAG